MPGGFTEPSWDLGKTDFVIPVNALLQVQMTTQTQFVVFPEGKLMNQYLGGEAKKIYEAMKIHR